MESEPLCDDVTRDLKGYWRTYFTHRHAEVNSIGPARSLDYPNDKIRFQIYSHMLEAAGAVAGLRVLDVGCGWGTGALILSGCDANVTAIDIVPETIASLTERYPAVDLQVVDIANEGAVEQLPRFNCIFAAEVLQHVEFDVVIKTLWEHLLPGGRLVGSIPNSECPIIRDVVGRFDGFFRPMSALSISSVARSLPDMRDFWIRGLTFQADQYFLPYWASEWGKEIAGTPNRLVFCVLRDPTDHWGV
jgi:2-polyprenyl-3-methyl-5-hydroxy-6-metoxy-1,4-benzoquinol methylase